MRKIKMNKDTVVDTKLIEKLIKDHADEKARILKMKDYYNNDNQTIMNREYKDAQNKPSNRLSHDYASYITDNFVGYLVGQPISYKSDNEQLLEELNLSFLYNDEIDNNTTLAQEQSICGYAYELMYRDEESNARFKAVDTEEMIVVYENNLEEKELFAIRYITDNDDKGTVYVYTLDGVEAYELSSGKVKEPIPDESDSNYFSQLPVITYENNRQRRGDFEKVIRLIDAYDQANSDTANDFEYFTNAILVISGLLLDDEDEDGNPLNFKENRVLNFGDVASKAEYLIKNINDTALENYKNRLHQDIIKFSNVIDVTDQNFASNLSGIALKWKMQGMENKASIKESKLRKGLMKRIELLIEYMGLKTNTDYTYTEITPVFTRNIPVNDVEIVNMVKSLYGMLSDKTLISQISFVEDVQAELDSLEKQKEEQAVSYDNFGSDETSSTTEEELLLDE